ncbi:hypothetical protein Tco_1124966 [Tanacetum coccineum]|uniref:Uncharacterized protein n=1 Tax=Tanacetum coccineum TaxID=301880 RepID=A0ABQ5J8A2_9ASTR
MEQQQPLLTEEKNESEKWHRYPSVGRTGSMIPTASEVSVDEIRSAANDSIYPPSLHAPLISSPDPPPYVTGTHF